MFCDVWCCCVVKCWEGNFGTSFEKGLRTPTISWVFKVLVKCGNPLFRGVSHLNRKKVRSLAFGSSSSLVGYLR